MTLLSPTKYINLPPQLSKGLGLFLEGLDLRLLLSVLFLLPSINSGDFILISLCDGKNITRLFYFN